MIEKEYKLSKTNEKAIEKVIFDENLHYLHMRQAGKFSLVALASNQGIWTAAKSAHYQQ